MLINACQIFLMFRYYAYGEKYVELVQFWLNFLEERRLVAWGRGTKVASVFFFFLERNGRTDSYGSSNFTGMCDVNQCLSNFFDVSLLRIWWEIFWVGTVLAEFSRGKETCSMRAGGESGLCFFFFLERNGRTDSYGSSNFTGMCDVNQCLSNFFDVSVLRIWREICWVGTVLAEFSRGKETCSMRAGGESGLCFFFFFGEKR